jgi:hypothetical protein
VVAQDLHLHRRRYVATNHALGLIIVIIIIIIIIMTVMVVVIIIIITTIIIIILLLLLLLSPPLCLSCLAATIFQVNLSISAWTTFLVTGFQLTKLDLTRRKEGENAKIRVRYCEHASVKLMNPDGRSIRQPCHQECGHTISPRWNHPLILHNPKASSSVPVSHTTFHCHLVGHTLSRLHIMTWFRILSASGLLTP